MLANFNGVQSIELHTVGGWLDQRVIDFWPWQSECLLKAQQHLIGNAPATDYQHMNLHQGQGIIWRAMPELARVTIFVGSNMYTPVGTVDGTFNVQSWNGAENHYWLPPDSLAPDTYRLYGTLDAATIGDNARSDATALIRMIFDPADARHSIEKVMWNDRQVWPTKPAITVPAYTASKPYDDAQIVIHATGLPAGDSFTLHWVYCADTGSGQSKAVAITPGAGEDPIVVSPTHDNLVGFFIFNGYDCSGGRGPAQVWIEYKGQTTQPFHYCANHYSEKTLNMAVDFSRLWDGHLLAADTYV